MSHGTKFLAKLLIEGKVTRLLEYGDLTEMFATEDEQKAYQYVRDHVRKYSSFPTADSVWEHTKLDIAEDPPEAAEYYLDRLRQKHIQVTLHKAASQCDELFSSQKLDDSVKAVEILRTATFEALRKTQVMLYDVRDAEEAIKAEQVKMTAGDKLYSIKFGWPTLDEMTSGFMGGDLISLVGRPSTGKSYLALYAAMRAWDEYDATILFVTLEMKALLLIQRLVSMASKAPLKALKKHSFFEFKDAIEGAMAGFKTKGAPFWILDKGSALTVREVETMARFLKPDFIVVDGAYMLKHENKKLGRYERVAENTEMLKDCSTDLDVPTLALFQFARSAEKKKKNEEPGLEDIGYTDVVGQISTVAMGLFEEETGVQQVKRRKINILKGRNGEKGMFYVKWDFENMDFSEWDPKAQIMNAWGTPPKDAKMAGAIFQS